MNLAIITNKPYDTCETFVKNHIDLLPFNKFHYWGIMPAYNLEQLKNKKLRNKVAYKLKLYKPIDGTTYFAGELKKNSISCVLAEYGTVGANVLPVCESLDIPLLVHFHGHDAVRHSVLKDYGAKYQAFFSYKKTLVVSVSHEMTKRLIKIGCPENKIIYNTYGPNQLFEKIQPKYSKNQFVSIGRFVEKKAPHITIMAFYEHLLTHPDSTFVYAGDGPLLDSAKNLVETLRIEKSIKFIGRISQQEYAVLLGESIAYIQHSIEANDGDMEGTPVAILEGSMAGLPVISTKHAGIPDVIIDNETGLLCEEKDYMAMAENLSWIIENKDKAMQMGGKGKQRCLENYTIDSHISGLTKIIKSAIVGRNETTVYEA